MNEDGMQPRAARLGHIGIVVADLDRSIRFYTEEVGLRLTERFDYGEDEVGHGVGVSSGAFVRSDSTHHCISLFKLRGPMSDDDDDEGRVRASGLHHIAFEMATHQNLLALYRRFQDRRVPIVNARRGGPGNQPRFYARDPDGHLLEFYWGIDQVGWDGRPRVYPPIAEIDLEDFDFGAYVEERERMASSARRPG